MLRREKRTKLEIFHDILNAIQEESSYGEIKPTRVQQKCNISYDKFSKYVYELSKRKLIKHDSSLYITDKGKQLLKDYGKIKDFLTEMKLEYLSEENHYEI
jgi:predicted transcriptional regulator